MNRARIKLLISDIRAAEREILRGAHNEDERELMGLLKTAVDDFRLTVWSSIVHPASGAERQQHVQTVRMARVVDMLRQINRDKRPEAHIQEKPFTFAELMRVAEEALSESHGRAH